MDLFHEVHGSKGPLPSQQQTEYIALTEGAKHLIWLWRFLQDLQLDQTQLTSIQSDNLGTITLSHNVTYHARMKHINVSYYFICEKVASNEVILTYIWLKDNAADLMTKGLDLNQHHCLHDKLGYSGGVKLRGSVEQQFSATDSSVVM